ncbi:uncharacterized protein LOC131657455 [Vicia villosa]|uniref:uncharacterized protein LOC131657455 n=1 Tax=Vicia villosa TaxID=3911 RepID=UPI00273A89A0|nr:uncharacterized protein LOC131657455 [Vicia villosa]
MVDMQDWMAKSFWRNNNIGYSFSNSVGRSGGLLTLWKNENLEVVSSFKGEGYLGIKFMKSNRFFYLVNIYSSCELPKKRDLWRRILELKEAHKDGEWILGGDFNATKNRSERRGRGMNSNSSVNSVEMNEFVEFIDESLLVYVPCKGKKFTWYNRGGNSMSRIDRFLLSENVRNDWGVVGQFVGNRDISDHCPIWLEVDNNDWGPKPFKFNNEWFSLASFYPFVEKEWNDIKVEGRGDYVLKEKLFRLKNRLKWWNKEVFGKIELEIEEGVRDINFGDDRLEVEAEDLHPEIIKGRKEATSRFWTRLRIKENMIVQKSRLRWLKEGDSNSGLFSFDSERFKSVMFG